MWVVVVLWMGHGGTLANLPCSVSIIGLPLGAYLLDEHRPAFVPFRAEPPD